MDPIIFVPRSQVSWRFFWTKMIVLILLGPHNIFTPPPKIHVAYGMTTPTALGLKLYHFFSIAFMPGLVLSGTRAATLLQTLSPFYRPARLTLRLTPFLLSCFAGFLYRGPKLSTSVDQTTERLTLPSRRHRRRDRELSLGGIVGMDLRLPAEMSDAECDLESLQQTLRLGDQPRALPPHLPPFPAHVQVFGSRGASQDFTIAV
ncbi:hypothetical protein FOCC_FOCC012627 [Frankliniella occidentalis]|nr:hypothetical protein FOCC_FOCC012627 [Frankliniella occidentalis]